MGPRALAPRVVGRAEVAGEGARFAWSGTSLVLRFEGDEVAVRLRAAPLEPRTVVVDGKPVVARDASTPYTVYVDDLAPSTIDVSAGVGRYELARDLGPGVHEVRLVREAEAFAGRHEVLGFDLPPEGALLAPEPAPLLIEWVGDSISCGYGVLGASAECPFSYGTERATAAYPMLVSRAVGADASLLCWSGRGVYRNYDGSNVGTMPELYERTLPFDGSPAFFPLTVSPASAASASPDDARERAQAPALVAVAVAAPARVPDAVVIGLGTNDFLGGRGAPLDVPAFEAAYGRFLSRVRELRPSAPVLITTSPMLSGARRVAMREALDRVVAARRSAGDAAVDLVDLEDQGARMGCDGHPNVAMHGLLAAQVEAALRPRLGRR